MNCCKSKTKTMENKRRLFDETPVDDKVVEAILALKWPGAKLNARIKTSINVTYTADFEGRKIIVRATSQPNCE